MKVNLTVLDRNEVFYLTQTQAWCHGCGNGPSVQATFTPGHQEDQQVRPDIEGAIELLEQIGCFPTHHCRSSFPERAPCLTCQAIDKLEGRQ